MRAACRALDAAARFDCTVLLHGESGTGKELAARRIHARSNRSGALFVSVDCTGLPESLADAQLFGHVKGAYTGADRETLGFFRAAEGGTLFLDEIGELSPALQAKLLRCVQERAVVPVGSWKAIPVNCRIIAATHRDLAAWVRDGRFRQDLYYRLNVVRVVLPPLRERREDVTAIAEHILERIGSAYGSSKRFSPGAMDALLAHDWPGNVRELANAVERAFVFSEGDEIGPGDLPDELGTGAVMAANVASAAESRDDPIVPLDVAERALISKALVRAGGRQSVAAEMLHIERRRLYRKVKAYGLEELTLAGVA